MEAPDWLAKRRGALRRGLNDATWLVTIDGRPLYKLVATTAGGKYTCGVTETVNGRRLDNGTIWNSLTEALNGGLEELRQKLGW